MLQFPLLTYFSSVSLGGGSETSGAATVVVSVTMSSDADTAAFILVSATSSGLTVTNDFGFNVGLNWVPLEQIWLF